MFAASLALVAAAGAGAAAQGPFDRLTGSWRGNGTVELANGTREPIRCRAVYNLPYPDQLQLNLRCAGESYNFDLRASAKYEGGAITGTWSEETRQAAGTITGNARGDHFSVRAQGPSFTASLDLTTRGSRQSVVIKTMNPDAPLRGATMTLSRS